MSERHPDAGTDHWCTTKWLADALGGFDLDPCSNERGHIRARQFVQREEVVRVNPLASGRVDLRAACLLERQCATVQGDGLATEWRGSVFCNPPYSSVLPWARKLAAHEGPWVALLKLDPTTKWWRELMVATPTVAPFRKRLAFENGKGSTMTANFPSVLVYSAWRPPRALVPHLWLPTYATGPTPGEGA